MKKYKFTRLDYQPSKNNLSINIKHSEISKTQLHSIGLSSLENNGIFNLIINIEERLKCASAELENLVQLSQIFHQGVFKSIVSKETMNPMTGNNSSYSKTILSQIQDRIVKARQLASDLMDLGTLFRLVKQRINNEKKFRNINDEKIRLIMEKFAAAKAKRNSILDSTDRMLKELNLEAEKAVIYRKSISSLQESLTGISRELLYNDDISGVSLMIRGRLEEQIKQLTNLYDMLIKNMLEKIKTLNDETIYPSMTDSQRSESLRALGLPGYKNDELDSIKEELNDLLKIIESKINGLNSLLDYLMTLDSNIDETIQWFDNVENRLRKDFKDENSQTIAYSAESAQKLLAISNEMNNFYASRVGPLIHEIQYCTKNQVSDKRQMKHNFLDRFGLSGPIRDCHLLKKMGILLQQKWSDLENSTLLNLVLQFISFGLLFYDKTSRESIKYSENLPSEIKFLSINKNTIKEFKNMVERIKAHNDIINDCISDIDENITPLMSILSLDTNSELAKKNMEASENFDVKNIISNYHILKENLFMTKRLFEDEIDRIDSCLLPALQGLINCHKRSEARVKKLEEIAQSFIENIQICKQNKSMSQVSGTEPERPNSSSYHIDSFTAREHAEKLYHQSEQLITTIMDEEAHFKAEYSDYLVILEEINSFCKQSKVDPEQISQENTQDSIIHQLDSISRNFDHLKDILPKEMLNLANIIDSFEGKEESIMPRQKIESLEEELSLVLVNNMIDYNKNSENPILRVIEKLQGQIRSVEKIDENILNEHQTTLEDRKLKVHEKAQSKMNHLRSKLAKCEIKWSCQEKHVKELQKIEEKFFELNKKMQYLWEKLDKNEKVTSYFNHESIAKLKEFCTELKTLMNKLDKIHGSFNQELQDIKNESIEPINEMDSFEMHLMDTVKSVLRETEFIQLRFERIYELSERIFSRNSNLEKKLDEIERQLNFLDHEAFQVIECGESSEIRILINNIHTNQIELHSMIEEIVNIEKDLQEIYSNIQSQHEIGCMSWNSVNFLVHSGEKKFHRQCLWSDYPKKDARESRVVLSGLQSVINNFHNQWSTLNKKATNIEIKLRAVLLEIELPEVCLEDFSTLLDEYSTKIKSLLEDFGSRIHLNEPCRVKSCNKEVELKQISREFQALSDKVDSLEPMIIEISKRINSDKELNKVLKDNKMRIFDLQINLTEKNNIIKSDISNLERLYTQVDLRLKWVNGFIFSLNYEARLEGCTLETTSKKFEQFQEIKKIFEENGIEGYQHLMNQAKPYLPEKLIEKLSISSDRETNHQKFSFQESSKHLRLVCTISFLKNRLCLALDYLNSLDKQWMFHLNIVKEFYEKLNQLTAILTETTYSFDEHFSKKNLTKTNSRSQLVELEAFIEKMSEGEKLLNEVQRLLNVMRSNLILTFFKRFKFDKIGLRHINVEILSISQMVNEQILEYKKFYRKVAVKRKSIEASVEENNSFYDLYDKVDTWIDSKMAQTSNIDQSEVDSWSAMYREAIRSGNNLRLRRVKYDPEHEELLNLTTLLKEKWQRLMKTINLAHQNKSSNAFESSPCSKLPCLIKSLSSWLIDLQKKLNITPCTVQTKMSRDELILNCCSIYGDSGTVQQLENETKIQEKEFNERYKYWKELFFQLKGSNGILEKNFIEDLEKIDDKMHDIRTVLEMRLATFDISLDLSFRLSDVYKPLRSWLEKTNTFLRDAFDKFGLIDINKLNDESLDFSLSSSQKNSKCNDMTLQLLYIHEKISSEINEKWLSFYINFRNIIENELAIDVTNLNELRAHISKKGVEAKFLEEIAREIKLVNESCRESVTSQYRQTLNDWNDLHQYLESLEKNISNCFTQEDEKRRKMEEFFDRLSQWKDSVTIGLQEDRHLLNDVRKRLTTSNNDNEIMNIFNLDNVDCSICSDSHRNKNVEKASERNHSETSSIFLEFILEKNFNLLKEEDVMTQDLIHLTDIQTENSDMLSSVSDLSQKNATEKSEYYETERKCHMDTEKQSKEDPDVNDNTELDQCYSELFCNRICTNMDDKRPHDDRIVSYNHRDHNQLENNQICEINYEHSKLTTEQFSHISTFSLVNNEEIESYTNMDEDPMMMMALNENMSPKMGYPQPDQEEDEIQINENDKSIDGLSTRELTDLDKEMSVVYAITCERLRNLERKNEGFDFEKWRKAFCEWYKSKNLRMISLFQNLHDFRDESESDKCSIRSERRRTPFQSTTRAQSFSEIMPKTRSLSRCSKPDTASVTSRITSRESSIIRNQTQTTTLSENQFVAFFQKHSANFKGSNNYDLIAAFRHIDWKKRGKISYEDFLLATKPSSMRIQNAPMSKVIDEVVEQEIKKCSCLNQFLARRIDNTRYEFGPYKRAYLMRILNSTIMVRVGGGWVSFLQFLNDHDPCRRISRRSSSIKIAKLPSSEVRSESSTRSRN